MISSQSRVVSSNTTTWDVATGASFVTHGYRWITYTRCGENVRSNTPPDSNEYVTEEEDVTCEGCLASLAQVVINERKRGAAGG